MAGAPDLALDLAAADDAIRYRVCCREPISRGYLCKSDWSDVESGCKYGLNVGQTWCGLFSK